MRLLTTDDLSERSTLQITLWSSNILLHQGTAAAFTAFGTDVQQTDLLRLGNNFVDFLRFRPNRFREENYPTLAGFRISAADYDECGTDIRRTTNRSARIVTQKHNGMLIRGFGDSDEHADATIVFWRLSSERWRKLARAFQWNPDNLTETANAPGIAFQAISDPEMSLLSPTAWM